MLLKHLLLTAALFTIVSLVSVLDLFNAYVGPSHYAVWQCPVDGHWPCKMLLCELQHILYLQ